MKKSRILILGAIILVVIAVAVWLVMSSTGRQIEVKDEVNSDTEKEKKFDSINDTLAQHTKSDEFLEKLFKTIPFVGSGAIKESLRFVDIDGDGDEDVLGFLIPYYDKDSPNRKTYIFSTWHKTEDGYVQYDDSYRDFRIYADELPCSILAIAIKHVTLRCSASGSEYPVELYYQGDGIGGYYTDFRDHALTFENHDNWSLYMSVGGISFRYPSDISVTEKTYEVFEKKVTVVRTKRGEQLLFEIHSSEADMLYGGGGGSIDNGAHLKFIKLSDGTFLERHIVSGRLNDFEFREIKNRKLAYRKAQYSKNNEGALHAGFSINNTVEGREHKLIAFSLSDADLEVIDTIFASIAYTKGVTVAVSEIVHLSQNDVTFGDTISFKIPGTIMHEEKYSTPDGVGRIKYIVQLIDSAIYLPVELSVSLEPYEDVGGVNPIGGGGYNLEKDKCFNYNMEYTDPITLGEFRACQFGWGDAGIAGTGYFLLDPEHKYIVNINVDLSSDGGDTTGYLHFDFDSVVKTVHII
jgi:hypothetical protein